MTNREKAIIMAHTGICTLTGDKFQIFHKYVEDIMGRPVMTHELLFLGDEIKEKSKADFIALCATSNGWIPCSERPPKESGKYLVTFGGTHLIGIDFYSTEEDARRDFEEPEEYIGWRSHNVLAWMPLPERYEESEEE